MVSFHGEPEPLQDADGMAYGCLFCITGREERIVQRIAESCPLVHAVTMRKMKYRTSHGQKRTEEALLLPSYVFFTAPTDTDPFQALPKTDVIRILLSNDGEWQLQGEDLRFAKWLFQYDGLLDFSKAHREGDRIRIISGPLKDMEGKITRIDKRGRSGQVMVEFQGRTIPIWLSFELIDPI